MISDNNENENKEHTIFPSLDKIGKYKSSLLTLSDEKFDQLDLLNYESAIMRMNLPRLGDIIKEIYLSITADDPMIFQIIGKVIKSVSFSSYATNVISVPMNIILGEALHLDTGNINLKLENLCNDNQIIIPINMQKLFLQYYVTFSGYLGNAECFMINLCDINPDIVWSSLSPYQKNLIKTKNKLTQLLSTKISISLKCEYIFLETSFRRFIAKNVFEFTYQKYYIVNVMEILENCKDGNRSYLGDKLKDVYKIDVTLMGVSKNGYELKKEKIKFINKENCQKGDLFLTLKILSENPQIISPNISIRDLYIKIGA
jgi:hypothetical protein